MFERTMFFLLLTAFTVGLAAPSQADRRSYVWTYEYKTMPKGMMELEYYQTLELPDVSNSKVSTWKYNVELEYGLTNHWDVSLYQNFKQENTLSGGSFSYDGFKLRTRYRIGESDQFIVDPLLYLEYQSPNDLSKGSALEGKIVLAKDLGSLNLSYNQIMKQSSSTENEYAAGLSVEMNPSLKLGLEGKGSYTSGKHYLGPTISLAAEKLWVNFGIVKGISAAADQLQARLLMGIFI